MCGIEKMCTRNYESNFSGFHLANTTEFEMCIKYQTFTDMGKGRVHLTNSYLDENDFIRITYGKEINGYRVKIITDRDGIPNGVEAMLSNTSYWRFLVVEYPLLWAQYSWAAKYYDTIKNKENETAAEQVKETVGAVMLAIFTFTFVDTIKSTILSYINIKNNLGEIVIVVLLGGVFSAITSWLLPTSMGYMHSLTGDHND